MNTNQENLERPSGGPPVADASLGDVPEPGDFLDDYPDPPKIPTVPVELPDRPFIRTAGADRWVASTHQVPVAAAASPAPQAPLRIVNRNPARRSVLLVALAANTDTLYIGPDQGVKVNYGFALAPGASIELELRAEVWAVAASGVQTVAVAELLDTD